RPIRARSSLPTRRSSDLSEIAAMKTRPSWPALVASTDSAIRQDRALAAYRFDAERMKTLTVPTLLLTGSKTASPQLKQAIDGLIDRKSSRLNSSHVSISY